MIAMLPSIQHLHPLGSSLYISFLLLADLVEAAWESFDNDVILLSIILKICSLGVATVTYA